MTYYDGNMVDAGCQLENQKNGRGDMPVKAGPSLRGIRPTLYACKCEDKTG